MVRSATDRRFRCAGCVMAVGRAFGASPSIGPVTTTTRTRGCPRGASAGRRRKRWIAPAGCILPLLKFGGAGSGASRRRCAVVVAVSPAVEPRTQAPVSADHRGGVVKWRGSTSTRWLGSGLFPPIAGDRRLVGQRHAVPTGSLGRVQGLVGTLHEVFQALGAVPSGIADTASLLVR
jgi:hypothetical protein